MDGRGTPSEVRGEDGRARRLEVVVGGRREGRRGRTCAYDKGREGTRCGGQHAMWRTGVGGWWWLSPERF